MLDRSPIVSEFETEELEANYTAWLRAKVEASLADSRPAFCLSHATWADSVSC